MLTCKLKCTHYAIAQAAANQHEFAVALIRRDTTGQLMASGAKAYWLGGGWWKVSGYASNGSDVVDTVNTIRNHMLACSLRTNRLHNFQFVGEEV